MKRYTTIELKNMTANERWQLNDAMDEIAIIIGFKFSNYLEDLKTEVKNAQTQEDCTKAFIDYTREKQLELHEVLIEKINQLNAIDLLKFLKEQ